MKIKYPYKYAQVHGSSAKSFLLNTWKQGQNDGAGTNKLGQENARTDTNFHVKPFCLVEIE